ncbi:hypothetical protein NFI96_008358 [Prochilodus magdalenae]|nr:hypothetical protein NFI96_008358 [Prochilodus magdalenae]
MVVLGGWCPGQRLVGNTNSDTVVHHKLSHPIRTRFLRFVPVEWNTSGRVGLRVEAYGCAYSEYLITPHSGYRTLPTGHSHRTQPKGRCPQDTTPLYVAHRTPPSCMLPTGHHPLDATPLYAAPQNAVHRTLLGWMLQHWRNSTRSCDLEDSVVWRDVKVSLNLLLMITCSHEPSFYAHLESYVADFDGRSSLLYRFNQKSMSTVKDVISLRFKSRQAEGVLLHGEGQRGDYITLELHRGRLALHLNLDDTRVRSSSGRMVVTLGSLLDDQHWHSVLIERFNKQVNFTLDRHTQHFRAKGDGDSLEVDYELSFGGIPLPGKPGTFLRRNFHGCVENLYYNGVNIIDLAKRRKPQIYSVIFVLVGNVTFSCSEPQLVAATFLSSSSSFLSLPAPAPTLEGLSVRLQFRTWNPDGLLLSARLASDQEPCYLLLQISSGRLRLTHHTSDLKTSEVSTVWHRAAVFANPTRQTSRYGAVEVPNGVL